VCLRAESLGDHGGAWKVTLNTAGDAFTFADLRCEQRQRFYLLFFMLVTEDWREGRSWAA
jgi:hypothetical protein